MSEDLVLVTGASGYIATHVVKLLLQQGYHVRGTVRSLDNEVKVKPLRDLCPDAKHPLELVEADLLDDESWVQAVNDCKYVLHIASPLPLRNPATEDEVIKPAVNGTLAVLKACGKSVKRVVLTSSTAAVNDGFLEREIPWNEEDWINPDTVTYGTYVKSKVLAEKAAWDYLASLPEENRFELAVINPGLAIGPLLCATLTTSVSIPHSLIEGMMPGVPKFSVGVVDVRDVALAHVSAMTKPEAAGHRHILVTETVSMKKMGLILDEELRPQGYKIPTTELPNFLVKLVSFFDPSLKLIVPGLGMHAEYDTTRMREILGISPRDMKNTMTDMAYSMIEAGHVKKTQQYTGPRFSE